MCDPSLSKESIDCERISFGFISATFAIFAFGAKESWLMLFLSNTLLFITFETGAGFLGSTTFCDVELETFVFDPILEITDAVLIGVGGLAATFCVVEIELTTCFGFIADATAEIINNLDSLYKHWVFFVYLTLFFQPLSALLLMLLFLSAMVMPVSMTLFVLLSLN
jgi:hypothetical protein